MKVCNLRLETNQDKVRLCADIHLASEDEEKIDHIWYEYPPGYIDSIDTSGDAFFAATLLSAMMLGEDLQIIAPVSNKLLDNAQNIINIYKTWFPIMRSINVIAERIDKNQKIESGKKTLSFLSLGVDSFFTLFNHLEEIDNLVLVHGFDIKLDNTKLFSETYKKANEVAVALDKKLIPVRTNVGEFANRFLDFGLVSHGSLLSSVGLTLGLEHKRVYIASSFTYDVLFPWGSHPMTDPLWSSDKTTIIHDGCETTRPNKITDISKYEVVMDTLRVCHEDLKDNYNCGKCEKCVRTMIGLRIAGALEKCTIFKNPLTLDAVRKMNIANQRDRIFLQENIDILKAMNSDELLLDALLYCQKRTDPSTLSNRLKRIAHIIDSKIFGARVFRILNR